MAPHADPPLILTSDWLATSLFPALFRHTSNLTRWFSRANCQNFHPIGWLPLLLPHRFRSTSHNFGSLQTYLPWSLLKSLSCLPLNFHPLQHHLPLSLTCSDGLGISQLPPLGYSPLSFSLQMDGFIYLSSPTFTIRGLTPGSMVWQFSHECSPWVVAPRY
jgi:hypothetical protein